VNDILVNTAEPDAISKLYGLIASNSGVKTPTETEVFYNALDELTKLARIAGERVHE
jgi:hypothetical protein